MATVPPALLDFWDRQAPLGLPVPRDPRVSPAPWDQLVRPEKWEQQAFHPLGQLDRWEGVRPALLATPVLQVVKDQLVQQEARGCLVLLDPLVRPVPPVRLLYLQLVQQGLLDHKALLEVSILSYSHPQVRLAPLVLRRLSLYPLGSPICKRLSKEPVVVVVAEKQVD